VGTFAVAIAYMHSQQIEFEEHMALFVVILEIPAILIGIILARGVKSDTQWGQVLHEVLLGKGVVLLIGGLIIGWISGPKGVASISPLFFDLFKGVLALFLLEMGLIASSQLSSLKRYGLFLVVFGILMPLFSGFIGLLAAQLIGLSIGGAAILAT
jgi:hypothetical protein